MKVNVEIPKKFVAVGYLTAVRGILGCMGTTGKSTDVRPIDVAVGRVLQLAMRARGITQEKLAEEAGTNQPRLSEQLRGQKVLTLNEFDALCTALDLDWTKVHDDAVLIVTEGVSIPEQVPSAVRRRKPRSAPQSS